MSFSNKLRGTVRVAFHAAWPEALLNACAVQGIRLHRVVRTDACTLQAEVYERDWERVQRLATSRQAEVQVLERRGGSKDRSWLRRRVALLFSLLAAAALLIWSDLHIWEIELRGCERLSRGEVLRALEESGVAVGSYWPKLSAETVRSRMLLRVPTLSWMTVNVSGSRAVVWVAERAEKPEIYEEKEAADIVAARTGILRELTVLNGHPLVSPGYAVTQGETLVTGSLDSLSHPTRRVRARARVMADTWYEQTAVEPPGTEREETGKPVFGSASLKIGKKRIILFGGSRKELDGYDKIVHEYTVGIDGLFAFPLALIREEYRNDGQCGERMLPVGERLCESLSKELDGEILQRRIRTVEKDGFRYTTLQAHCLENIAQTAEIALP